MSDRTAASARVHAFKRRTGRQRSRALLGDLDANTEITRQRLAAGILPADAVRWETYIPTGNGQYRQLTPGEMTISAADRRFAESIERMRHGRC